MFSNDILIMVSAIAFCLGGLIGAIISRTLLPPKQQKDLQQELETTKNDLEQYQNDVAQHFIETSDMVNKLSQQYKDVHEHLSKGAMQLTNPEVSRLVIQASEGNLNIEQDDAHILEESMLDQPKDWAPKSPGQKGALSEEYGLEKKEGDTSISLETSNPNPNIPS